MTNKIYANINDLLSYSIYVNNEFLERFLTYIIYTIQNTYQIVDNQVNM